MAKISDFGVSHIFDDDVEGSTKTLTSMTSDLSADEPVDTNRRLDWHDAYTALVMSAMFDRGILRNTEGTFAFWSPEMCGTSENKKQRFSGYAADVWAAGVCLHIFATGRLPFFSDNPSELFDQIANSKVNYKRFNLTKSLKDLLRAVLKKNPIKRAGIGRLLEHSFCGEARAKRIEANGSEVEKIDGDKVELTKDEVDRAISMGLVDIFPTASDLAEETIDEDYDREQLITSVVRQTREHDQSATKEKDDALAPVIELAEESVAEEPTGDGHHRKQRIPSVSRQTREPVQSATLEKDDTRDYVVESSGPSNTTKINDEHGDLRKFLLKKRGSLHVYDDFDTEGFCQEQLREAISKSQHYAV